MSYYLAPSLVKLRDQINARWPNRSKASDGWIGDAAHNARKSDHNPDYDDNGVVRAIDVTLNGVNMAEIIAAVQADSRTSYFIHKGIIRGEPGFHARKYAGANAHNVHIHVSIKSTKAAESGHAWKLGSAGNVAPSKTPAASKQPTNFSKLAVDGIAGKATIEALQIVMRAIKTYSRAVDGDAGAHTWKAVQTWLQGLGYYPSSKYVIDGKPGKATIKALQTFLVNKGHLNSRKWLIDGKFQKETIKALQRYLNTQKG